MINTYNLFAATVVHTKMPISFDIHQKIISFVENNYTEDNINSVVNGLQVHGEFDGRKEIVNILDNFLKNTLNLEITHSWLNVLGDNSHNNPHSHPGTNETNSGVFYLSRNNNNITFTRDSNIFELKPKLFDLIIFPYDLLHYVLPENRNEKRISFAFNLSGVKKGE